MFHHKGATILLYFKTNNPLTLESIIYGFVTGVMLVTMFQWFSCYQMVITSDKLMYLFGTMIPALSLVVSMVLRFVPRLKDQIEHVRQAQACIGKDMSQGNIIQRARNGMKVVSSVITWVLENSIDTADSMKARGYGLRGRTNFSIYTLDGRDKRIGSIIICLIAVIILATRVEAIFIQYYPLIQMNTNRTVAIMVYFLYGILCFLPVILNVMEDVKWHYLKSKI